MTKPRVDNRVDSPRLPGSIFVNSTTGYFYWRVLSRLVPEHLRGTKDYTAVPLKLGGMDRPTRNRRAAERCRRNLWERWQRERDAAPDTVEPEPWILRFERWNRTKASDQQARYNAYIVRQFYASRDTIYDLDAAGVEDYLTVLGESMGRRTVQAHRNTLSMFARWLKRRGQLDSNPVEDVQVKAPRKHAPRYLRQEHVSRLLRRAKRVGPTWVYHAVCLGLHEGLRRSELARLTWRDVGQAEIVVHDKADDWHNVPIFPEMVPILTEMRRRADDQPVFPEHNPRWWGELLVRITEPLPVFGTIGRRVGSQWHLLRSTWAVNRARGMGLEAPASLWELMAWGGWKVPTTPMRYINVARAAGMV